jgi:hypothetical protein
MKIKFLVVLFCLATAAQAQRIAPNDLAFLKSKDDSLKNLGLKIVTGKFLGERLTADSLFTKAFVRALRTKNSFQYSFDSIVNVSKQFAPDSSFKIFTWQFKVSDNNFRQHGAIQMRTTDGSLKILPLIDKSDIIYAQDDTITDNANWIGAVYYKIIQRKQTNGNPVYFLFGFDENSIKSDRKICDVLEFVNGKPVFGKKLFAIKNKTAFPKNAARLIFEFKKESGARLNYDKDEDAIVFDELVSDENTPNKRWTLVPDGEMEAFRWRNGFWVHYADLFNGAPVKKVSTEKQFLDKTPASTSN